MCTENLGVNTSSTIYLIDYSFKNNEQKKTIRQ